MERRPSQGTTVEGMYEYVFVVWSAAECVCLERGPSVEGAAPGPGDSVPHPLPTSATALARVGGREVADGQTGQHNRTPAHRGADSRLCCANASSSFPVLSSHTQRMSSQGTTVPEIRQPARQIARAGRQRLDALNRRPRCDVFACWKLGWSSTPHASQREARAVDDGWRSSAQCFVPRALSTATI